MRSVVVALAVLVFAGAVSGCTFASQTATPTISRPTFRMMLRRS